MGAALGKTHETGGSALGYYDRVLRTDDLRYIFKILWRDSRGLMNISRIQTFRVGGERGIRTLGRVSPTHAFQACSFNHSDISPL
jgi:hypothetical protein